MKFLGSWGIFLIETMKEIFHLFEVWSNQLEEEKIFGSLKKIKEIFFFDFVNIDIFWIENF